MEGLYSPECGGGAGERQGRERVEGEREGGKLDSDDWRCFAVVGEVMEEEEGGGGRWTCTEAIIGGRGQESSDRSGAGVIGLWLAVVGLVIDSRGEARLSARHRGSR